MSSITLTRVQQFNGLFRPEVDAWGLPNHYHFAVKKLPILAGEAVFMVNPYNAHNHSEGRSLITSLSTEDQAKVIVPLLLEAFVSRFEAGTSMIHQMHDNCFPWVPWTWSTTDQVLATAVSNRLRELDVRSDLCDVGVSTPSEVQNAEKFWRQFRDDLTSQSSASLTRKPPLTSGAFVLFVDSPRPLMFLSNAVLGASAFITARRRAKRRIGVPTRPNVPRPPLEAREGWGRYLLVGGLGEWDRTFGVLRGLAVDIDFKDFAWSSRRSTLHWDYSIIAFADSNPGPERELTYEMLLSLRRVLA